MSILSGGRSKSLAWFACYANGCERRILTSNFLQLSSAVTQRVSLLSDRTGSHGAKAGYVDFVCPMNYTEDTNYFTELLADQLALMPKGVTIYPGIGATATNSLLAPDAVVEQIYLSRSLRASGWTIFDYSLDISETVLPALGMGVTKSKAQPSHTASHLNQNLQD